MGYKKTIKYGSNLEFYTYEKDIRYNGSGKSRNSGRVKLQSVVEDTGVKLLHVVQKRQSNIRRSGLVFRRLILANLQQSSPPALVTCTYAENQDDLSIAYKDFNSFIRALRYKFGEEFRYISVPEFQKRGAIHFHTLFWGLPDYICEQERHTRLVASLWGRGFVDCYLTDNNEKISSYLAKYMMKSSMDKRLGFKKAFHCSRNIIRPVVDKSPMVVELQYLYGIDVDNPPLQDKTFMTQWLGKGRYRIFNISNNSNN